MYRGVKSGLPRTLLITIMTFSANSQLKYPINKYCRPSGPIVQHYVCEPFVPASMPSSMPAAIRERSPTVSYCHKKTHREIVHIENNHLLNTINGKSIYHHYPDSISCNVPCG